LGKAFFPAKYAVFNNATVATDHIDRLPAPTFHATMANLEVSHPRKLDAVEVSPGPHVFNREVLQNHMMGGRFKRASVVDVQAVGLLTLEPQVSQDEMTPLTNLQPRLSPDKHRRILGVSPLDNDGSIGPAVNICYVDVPGVLPR
jgi:hypothetical protein